MCATALQQQAQLLTARELRGEQISKIVKQLRLACCAVASRSCSFMGVFSADQIPSREKLCSFAGGTQRKRKKRKIGGATAAKDQQPCCYRARSFIVNTDPSTLPGHHWVAFVVFADRSSVIYFFDSFGMPLTNYQELYNSCLNYAYFSDADIVTSVNTRSLQGATSTVCGHYCILFLYLCARLSLETPSSSSSRTLTQYGDFALSATCALVQVTGGDLAEACERDAALVDVLNQLLKRNGQLPPALSCNRLGGTASAHRQCCWHQSVA